MRKTTRGLKSPGAHELARASGSKPADTAQSVPMLIEPLQGDKPTDTTNWTDPNENDDNDRPALEGTDVSGIDDGEQVVVYERDRIVTGGNFLHVRPRDCVGLEDAR